jgi:pilus assembly protein Flp/PilA
MARLPCPSPVEKLTAPRPESPPTTGNLVKLPARRPTRLPENPRQPLIFNPSQRWHGHCHIRNAAKRNFGRYPVWIWVFKGRIEPSFIQSNLIRKSTMNTIIESIKTFWKDEEGLTTVEYAVAGGLISLAVIGAFRALGTTVGGVITNIDGQLSTVPNL